MRSRGFTLLEALVTLVIVSLVATVLMQSLSHVLGLRERVLRNEREARIAALHERWFRDTVAAAVADLPQGEAAFRGDAAGLRFLGTDPLADGRASPVEWRLVRRDGDLVLEYVEQGQPWTVLAHGLEGANFRYLDAAGRWQARWPPGAVDPLAAPPTVEEAGVLPRAVALAMEGATGSRYWLAAIDAGPVLPLPLRVQSEAGHAGF